MEHCLSIVSGRSDRIGRGMCETRINTGSERDRSRNRLVPSRRAVRRASIRGSCGRDIGTAMVKDIGMDVDGARETRVVRRERENMIATLLIVVVVVRR